MHELITNIRNASERQLFNRASEGGTCKPKNLPDQIQVMGANSFPVEGQLPLT